MNHIEGLANFLARCRDRGGDASRELMLNRSGWNGNINVDGAPTTIRARLHAPIERGFWSSIEPGVRTLLRSAMKLPGCVTYSSCQGHAPCDGDSMRLMHVGLLLEDGETAHRCLTRLEQAVDAFLAIYQGADATVCVAPGEVTTEGPSLRCIDILLPSQSGRWELYGPERTGAAEVLTACLDRANATADSWRMSR